MGLAHEERTMSQTIRRFVSPGAQLTNLGARPLLYCAEPASSSAVFPILRLNDTVRPSSLMGNCVIVSSSWKKQLALFSAFASQLFPGRTQHADVAKNRPWVGRFLASVLDDLAHSATPVACRCHFGTSATTCHWHRCPSSTAVWMLPAQADPSAREDSEMVASGVRHGCATPPAHRSSERHHRALQAAVRIRFRLAKFPMLPSTP